MLLLLALAACTGEVEDFPRSSTPLGVGTQQAPPASGDDTASGDTGDADTGGPAPGDDTGKR